MSRMRVWLVGERFGRLEVVSMHHENRAGAVEGRRGDVRFWTCRCDCGNEVVAGTNELTQGYMRSCGCKVLNRNVCEDHTGERYGRLVVVSKEEADSGGNSRWRCRCDCGNEKVFLWKNLKSGMSRSCGCLRNERIREAVERRRNG